MRVIADSYSNLCSQSSQPRGHDADTTLKMQVQGNAIIYLFLEDGICIRNKHTFVSSNGTKYSLTLFLAQQLTNQSNLGEPGDRNPQKCHCKLGTSCGTSVSKPEES